MNKIVLFLIIMVIQPNFKQNQLRFERVRQAYSDKENNVKSYFDGKNIRYSAFRLFIRAFKKEKQVELWVSESDNGSFTLLHTYAICADSGMPGPKRKEGDFQVPEGVYAINHFNPDSKFHLSLGVDYPNASDRILSDRQAPGSDIYLHGSCATIGCIPLTDDKIKELYVLAIEARSHGQQQIPVHIFPAKLSSSGLSTLSEHFPHHASFWQNLKIVYDDFEKTKKLRLVRVDNDGKYIF